MSLSSNHLKQDVFIMAAFLNLLAIANVSCGPESLHVLAQDPDNERSEGLATPYHGTIVSAWTSECSFPNFTGTPQAENVFVWCANDACTTHALQAGWGTKRLILREICRDWPLLPDFERAEALLKISYKSSMRGVLDLVVRACLARNMYSEAVGGRAFPSVFVDPFYLEFAQTMLDMINADPQNQRSMILNCSYLDLGRSCDPLRMFACLGQHDLEQIDRILLQIMEDADVVGLPMTNSLDLPAVLESTLVANANDRHIVAARRRGPPIVDGLVETCGTQRYGVVHPIASCSLTSPPRHFDMETHQWQRARNVGDSVQTLGAVRLVPAVDFIFDRQRWANTSKATLERHAGQRTLTIVNGFYGDAEMEWPPPEYIDPIVVSVHLAPSFREVWSSESSVAWLRRHTPVGCRDEETRALLRSMGVDAEVVGCVTLTSRMLTKSRPRELVGEVVVVEPASIDGIPAEILEGCRTNVHVDARHCDDFFESEEAARARSGGNDEEWTWEKGQAWEVKKAHAMVEEYAAATVLITSRLHAALPAVGAGVPVVFVWNQTAAGPGRRGAYGVQTLAMSLDNPGCKARFSGFERLFLPAVALDRGSALRAHVDREMGVTSEGLGTGEPHSPWAETYQAGEARTGVDGMLRRQLEMLEQWPQLAQYFKTMSVWERLGLTRPETDRPHPRDTPCPETRVPHQGGR